MSRAVQHQLDHSGLSVEWKNLVTFLNSRGYTRHLKIAFNGWRMFIGGSTGENDTGTHINPLLCDVKWPSFNARWGKDYGIVGQDQRVTAVAISDSGETGVTGHGDGTIRFWDLKMERIGSECDKYELMDQSPIEHLSFVSGESRLIVVAGGVMASVSRVSCGNHKILMQSTIYGEPGERGRASKLNAFTSLPPNFVAFHTKNMFTMLRVADTVQFPMIKQEKLRTEAIHRTCALAVKVGSEDVYLALITNDSKCMLVEVSPENPLSSPDRRNSQVEEDPNEKARAKWENHTIQKFDVGAPVVASKIIRSWIVLVLDHGKGCGTEIKILDYQGKEVLFEHEREKLKGPDYQKEQGDCIVFCGMLLTMFCSGSVRVFPLFKGGTLVPVLSDCSFGSTIVQKYTSMLIEDNKGNVTTWSPTAGAPAHGKTPPVYYEVDVDYDNQLYWFDICDNVTRHDIDALGLQRSDSPVFAIIVFDVTDRKTFDAITDQENGWFALAQKLHPQFLVVVGHTKAGAPSSRAVEESEAREWASDNGCTYIETSQQGGEEAFGESVKELFVDIILQEIIRRCG